MWRAVGCGAWAGCPPVLGWGKAGWRGRAWCRDGWRAGGVKSQEGDRGSLTLGCCCGFCCGWADCGLLGLCGAGGSYPGVGAGVCPDVEVAW